MPIPWLASRGTHPVPSCVVDSVGDGRSSLAACAWRDRRSVSMAPPALHECRCRPPKGDLVPLRHQPRPNSPGTEAGLVRNDGGIQPECPPALLWYRSLGHGHPHPHGVSPALFNSVTACDRIRSANCKSLQSRIAMRKSRATSLPRYVERRRCLRLTRPHRDLWRRAKQDCPHAGERGFLI